MNKAMGRQLVKAPVTFSQVLERMGEHGPSFLPESPLARIGRMLGPAQEKRPKVAKERLRKAVRPDTPEIPPPFSTYSQLAERWGVSWGTVQNWLRDGHVPVLDRAPRGKRGKKVVARKEVLEFERRNTKRLR